MSINLPDFLDDVIDAGISVTISKDAIHGVCIDLNTHAKSEAIIFEECGKWLVTTRYEPPTPVNNIDDIKSIVADCMCGRNFINEAWRSFLGDMIGR
jgi:hypothetical protein